MKIIAGLGNPGAEYASTPHSVGFEAVDAIAAELGGAWEEKRQYRCLWAQVRIGSEPCILVKPQTYMNESGRSVAQIAKFFKIAPEDILIIHDDMDMPLAKIRIRAGGKSGGHNGIKSIIADLGTEKFNRLKIGIRHPQKQSVVSWVLTPFDADQQKAMDQAFATSAKIIDDFIAGKSAQYLMNKYN